MKLTRHNGRAGKNGVYNPKHNDRSFDIANSEHIDEERAKQNLYWDCYNGFRNFKNPDKENELSATFEDVEQLFYRQRYRDFVTGQNERNVKNRHPERNKETGDLLKSKKTCPEETVYQIGTLDNHVPPELLIEIVTEFMEIVNERFGSHVHILNWALHLDESTPHIHERHVFDCENQYGEIAPQQEKALEALGFELPEPEKPVGRKNNRKMTFDSACRVLLFDVAKKHGLQLEEEPEYGGRAYLEKQDYILFKQKEQLAAQEQKLEELTMKIEDVEALVDEVADIAYDKAVEVVADTVKLETHKEDIKLVEQSIQLKFRVTPQEREMIETKMAQFGTTNMAAYLRKMAIDGYVVKLDLPELRELVSLLRYSSNNLNQLTRRAHETGRIYETDLEDIQQSQERIWTAVEKIVSSLAALK